MRERAFFFFLFFTRHHHFNKPWRPPASSSPRGSSSAGPSGPSKRTRSSSRPEVRGIDFFDDGGTTAISKRKKKETTRKMLMDALARRSSRPSQAPFPSLIRLESRGHGDDSVATGLVSEEEEECESRRAGSEARVSQPSLSSSTIESLPLPSSVRIIKTSGFLGFSLPRSPLSPLSFCLHFNHRREVF